MPTSLSENIADTTSDDEDDEVQQYCSSSDESDHEGSVKNIAVISSL